MQLLRGHVWLMSFFVVGWHGALLHLGPKDRLRSVHEIGLAASDSICDAGIALFVASISAGIASADHVFFPKAAPVDVSEHSRC